MKRIFTFLIFVFIYLGLFSQTFTGTTGAIPDNQTETCFSAPVAGIGALNCIRITLTLRITHTKDQDIDMYLVSPTGTRVMVATDCGGNGDHYNTTTFAMSSANLITAGTAPFNGTYRPEGDFDDFTGLNANGNWQLCITDDNSGTSGTLNSWSITFASFGTPVTYGTPCTAQPVAVSTSCSYSIYSNICAGNSAVANPSCGTYRGDDIWFTAVVPVGGNMVIDSDEGTLTDLEMAVYSGPDCNTLTPISCNLNSSANGNMPRIVVTGQVPGTTIWIRMWDLAGNEYGDFGLCVWYSLTSITTCSGNFYDTGGSAGDYWADEDYQVTYCPSVVGSTIQMNFSVFDIETGNDWISVYDGDNTTAPSLGTYDNSSPLAGIVSATGFNPTGCLTFVFHSNGSTEQGGWAASINCAAPCQDVYVGTLVTNPPYYTVDGINYVDICENESVSYIVSGSYPENNTNYNQNDASSVFTWHFGDGQIATGTSVSHIYAGQEGHDVDLTIIDVNGCRNLDDLAVRVRTSTTPIFAGTVISPSPVCLGTSVALNGVITPVQASMAYGADVAGVVYLPDGTGVTYFSGLNFANFTPGATVTAVTDIVSICANMEHSYMGDLSMVLRCPDGSGMTVFLQGGDGTILGEPVADNLPVDDNTTLSTPGIGYDYCWTPTSVSGTIDNAANWQPVVNYIDPVGQTSPGTIQQLRPGNYQIDGNWTDLLGCPLNGTWTIEITDHLGLDNGYIFNWGINFAPSLYPIQWSYTPTIVSQTWTGPNVTISTNPGAATPAATGNLNYTFTVVDNFNCTYDTVIPLTVNPIPVATATNDGPYCVGNTINLFATGPVGATYTWSGPNAFSSLVQNPSIINCTAAAAGVYTAVVQPLTGCNVSKTTTVVIDTQNPTASNPLPLSVQCFADVPVVNTAVVTDEADDLTINPTVTWVSDVSAGVCPRTITRTYKVADACGNFINVTQTITIIPSTVPVVPANGASTVACPASAVAPVTPAVTDVCGNNIAAVLISTVDNPNPVTCEGTRIYTYTYTDCAGNASTWTYTYTIDYSGALTPPANGSSTVSCPAAAVNPGAPANINDACGRSVVPVLVGSTEVPNPVTCEGTVVWRYRYTACDGVTTADWTYTYTIDYSGGLTPPANGSSTVACPAAAVNPGAPANILDACGGSVVPVLIGSVSVPSPVTCEGSVVWTYRYTACDGTTTADWTYTYTVDYSGALVPPVNGSSTVSCLAAAVNPGAPANVLDACGRSVVPVLIGSVDAPNPVTCEGTRIWTYRYTACDGTTIANWTYTYTIDYSGALTPPANGASTVSCPALAVNPGAPANINDACGRAVLPVLVGFVDAPSPVTCEGTRIWTYRYTACDGTTIANWTYTYTIDYSGALTPPVNGSSTVSCPVAAVNPGAPANINDACGRSVIPVLIGSTDVPNPITCEGARVWRYRYTACDGITTADWTYTYTIDYSGGLTPPANGS
jgi:subtilisin-like proprotein convertase family protein